MLILVSYISPDILSDPVTLNQFFISHRARPFYQSSGPCSRQSIQELHAAYCQPTPTKCGIDAGVANAGPAVTMGEASACYALSSPDLKPTQDICTMVPADNSTGYQSEGMVETDMYSQSSKTEIPGNELTIPDLWAELPFHVDLTMGAPSIAGNEDIADEAQPAASDVPLGTADFEPDESKIPENKLMPSGLWVELPFGDELTVVSTGKVANKPLAVNAQLGACSVAPRAADCELGVSSIVDEQMKPHQNATGKKEVEKWKEKGWAWNEVEERKGTAVEAAEREGRAEVGDNSGNMEEPGNGDRPCSSDEFTSDAIQNQSVLPIRTASKWDPSSSKLAHAIPATDEGKEVHELASGNPPAIEQHREVGDARNPKGIVVKTIFREPVHPVAEFLWPPEIGAQRACHATLTKSIAILSMRLENEYLAAREKTANRTSSSGVALDSPSQIPMVTGSRNGTSLQYYLDNTLYPSGSTGMRGATVPNWSNMRNRQSTGCSDINHSTALGGLLYRTCLELGRQWWPSSWHRVESGKWLLRKIGYGLRGGIWERKVWDPGGRRAKALFTAVRPRERRERWAG